jgi:hypothetical protein
MEQIASALITGMYVTDFSVHDSGFIQRTKGKTSFIWFVYDNGTHIYEPEIIEDIRRLKDIMYHYENYSKKDFCMYRYDGNILFPVFPSVIRAWIKEKLNIQSL